MPKLKCYIANLDGLREGLVATTSQAKATKLLGVGKQWICTCDHAEPGDLDFALRTPDVVWQRRQTWSKPQPRWIRRDPDPRADVLDRFPEARAVKGNSWGGDWWEIEDNSLPDEIGQGATEAKAWEDAARRINTEPPEGLTPDAIVIWRFDKAPKELRDLSPHGGDEDMVCWLPDGAFSVTPHWLYHIANHISTHPIRGGVVCIGAH